MMCAEVHVLKTKGPEFLEQVDSSSYKRTRRGGLERQDKVSKKNGPEQ